VGQSLNICGQGIARWVLVEALAGCLPEGVGVCQWGVSAVGVIGGRCIVAMSQCRYEGGKGVGCGVRIGVGLVGFHELRRGLALKSGRCPQGDVDALAVE